MARIPHLKSLQALEASVRLGSFRAAAAELGVTPAAVGQLVKKLEDHLGLPLLLRHANGFDPTSETRAAAALLTSGLSEVANALRLLERNTGGERLHLTVSPSIGERWLVPRLAGFLGRYPQLDLRIDTTPFAHFRWSNEFDFAVRYDRPGISGKEETSLFHEVLLPVCRPEIAGNLTDTGASNCLTKVPLLHVDRSTDDPQWFLWEDWGERFGVAIPAGPMRRDFAFTTMALRALDDGQGMHLAQLSLALDALRAGRLVAPFPKSFWVRPGYPYSLVRMSPGPERRIHRAFRSWILEESATMQAELDAFVTASA